MVRPQVADEALLSPFLPTTLPYVRSIATCSYLHSLKPLPESAREFILQTSGSYKVIRERVEMRWGRRVSKGTLSYYRVLDLVGRAWPDLMLYRQLIGIGWSAFTMPTEVNSKTSGST